MQCILRRFNGAVCVMFMSLVSRTGEEKKYPELAGTRVVITGITPTLGEEIVQAFAERKAKLLLQTSEAALNIAAKKGRPTKSSTEVKFYARAFSGSNSPSRFAQEAARCFGSIETLINLVSVTRKECFGLRSLDQIENMIVKKLSAPREITEVTANRMALTWSEGLILNILILFSPNSHEEAALAGIFKSTLSAMTRDQAKRWSESSVRINAVASHTSSSNLETEGLGTTVSDLTDLTLYLASNAGRQLTGHVFDAEGVSRYRC